MFASPEEKRRAQDERASDKAALLEALSRAGLVPVTSAADAGASVAWSPALATAVHCYLARSQSKLLLVQLDDLAAEELQANLPGSTSGYPSWRRRLRRAIEELSADPQILEEIAAIASARANPSAAM